MDVFIILALNEPPLLHLHYPSVAEAQAEIKASNDGTLPLEPYQLISQYTLEPLLKSVAETMPTLSVRFGCEFLSLHAGRRRRHRAGAHARRRDRAIRAAYLVGCDGGASTVRKQLGIKLRAKPISWSCARRCIAATSCSIGCRSATGRATAAIIMSPTTNDVPDHAGFDQALDAAFGRSRATTT